MKLTLKGTIYKKFGKVWLSLEMWWVPPPPYATILTLFSLSANFFWLGRIKKKCMNGCLLLRGCIWHASRKVASEWLEGGSRVVGGRVVGGSKCFSIVPHDY